MEYFKLPNHFLKCSTPLAKKAEHILAFTDITLKEGNLILQSPIGRLIITLDEILIIRTRHSILIRNRPRPPRHKKLSSSLAPTA